MTSPTPNLERNEARPDANGWLPIETAPKDGTIILISNLLQVYAAAWCPSVKGRRFPWVIIEDIVTHQPHGCCDWEDEERLEVNGWLERAPTHWQPLPKPPVGAA